MVSADRWIGGHEMTGVGVTPPAFGLSKSHAILGAVIAIVAVLATRGSWAALVGW